MKQLNKDGTFEYSSIIEIKIDIPRQLNLQQNYPNPFNPSTEIRYNLDSNAFVNLSIFDLSGRLIITLVKEEQSEGFKTVTWDGKDQTGRQMASGLYVYRLQAGSFILSKKMLLLR